MAKKFLDNFVLENFIVVLAQAPHDLLMQRYLARQQEQAIDVSELAKFQDRFKEEMQDSRIIQYQSVDFASLEQVVNQIVIELGVRGDYIGFLKNAQQAINSKDFIVLEGANGSGKSTLAKLLKVNMVGWHVTTLDYQQGDHFMRYLRAYSLQTTTLFDRGHISEVVYGQLLRNGNSFSPEELSALHEYVAQRGTLIFCNPPLDTIQERIKNTNYPKHIREEDLEKVSSLFQKTLTEHNLPYLTVDTSDPLAVESLIQQVRKTYKTLTYQDMNWS